jgi:hypothetical protein
MAPVLLQSVRAMTPEFLALFREFLGRNGWPADTSPWAVVERWDQFVATCTECYRWGLYEFENDVRVRDLLQRVFDDDRLAAFPQVAEMRRLVDEADQRFRELLTESPAWTNDQPWWRRGVLVRAGDEYCDDVKRIHGITVKRC